MRPRSSSQARLVVKDRRVEQTSLAGAPQSSAGRRVWLFASVDPCLAADRQCRPFTLHFVATDGYVSHFLSQAPQGTEARTPKDDLDVHFGRDK